MIRFCCCLCNSNSCLSVFCQFGNLWLFYLYFSEFSDEFYTHSVGGGGSLLLQSLIVFDKAHYRMLMDPQPLWQCYCLGNNWRARWKKGVSDDLRLKSKLLRFSWTLAHRLVFMWGTLLLTYFLTWDLKFEELAYYFCVKSFVELNSLKWCVKDFFCSLPELKQRNST